MNKIDVSIIVTTGNEEEHIGNCLRSIKGQNYPQNQLETIVVDNNSGDRTKEIAHQFTSLVYDRGPERSAQRNLGIKKARGRYILYLDADMILSQNIITECVAKCEEDNPVALFIPEKILGRGFWIKVRDFERSFYDATVIDCVRFVRRETALKIGGFDEDLTGPEDWDFNLRLNELGNFDIISSALDHNEKSFNIRNYISKKLYYSKDFLRYRKKWNNCDAIQRQLGFKYRFWGVFVEEGKWKKLLKNPVLALAMYALKVALAAAFISYKFFRDKKEKNLGH